jgi:hypothetical protein
MTTVYIDLPALFVGATAGFDAARLAPDAGSALGHLRDAGLEIVLLGAASAAGALGVDGAVGTDGNHAGTDEHRGHDRVQQLPGDATGWLVVGDAAACAQGRACRRLRTILVGPASPARGQAQRACDLEARDLTDAALTILAAVAMEPTSEPPVAAPVR